MTRAEERLILSGAVALGDKWPKPGHGAAPLSWLGPELLPGVATALSAEAPELMVPVGDDGGTVRAVLNAPATVGRVLADPHTAVRRAPPGALRPPRRASPGRRLGPAIRDRGSGRGPRWTARRGRAPGRARRRAARRGRTASFDFAAPAPTRAQTPRGPLAPTGPAGPPARHRSRRSRTRRSSSTPPAATAPTCAARCGSARSSRRRTSARTPRAGPTRACAARSSTRSSRRPTWARTPRRPAPTPCAPSRPTTRRCSPTRRLRTCSGCCAPSPTARSRATGRASAVRREAPFALLLGAPKPPPVAPPAPLLNGVVDVLATEPDGTALVVDYKTDRTQGDEDLGALVARDYALQRAAYALACLRAGHPAVEVVHLYLERAGEPVAVRRVAADAPALEALLLDAARPLLEGDHRPAAAPYAGLCARCPGRGGLCSWPTSMTDRPDPEAPPVGGQARSHRPRRPSPAPEPRAPRVSSEALPGTAPRPRRVGPAADGRTGCPARARRA